MRQLSLRVNISHSRVPLLAQVPTKRHASTFEAHQLGWIKARKQRREAAKRLPKPKQMRLPYCPPIRRHYRPLPLGLCVLRQWLDEQFKAGAWRDERALELLPLIERLPIDGALHSAWWRLELVDLGRGYPHYRLYFRRWFFGKVTLPIEYGRPLSEARDRETIQRNLAVYLTGCGWTPRNTAPFEGDARTPFNAYTRSLYSLF